MVHSQLMTLATPGPGVPVLYKSFQSSVAGWRFPLRHPSGFCLHLVWFCKQTNFAYTILPTMHSSTPLIVLTTNAMVCVRFFLVFLI